MITITDAGALAGYSSTDHLIDDRAIKDIIGRQYRSVGEALRAADSRCFMDAHGDHPRRPHQYTWVEVLMCDGSKRTHKSV